MIENRDKYLGFTFNGVSLGMKSESGFRGFIINSESDLAFFNGPQYTDEFVVPQYGDKTIYTGTTKSNRSFTLKIALDKINLRRYRQVLLWLNPNATGTFSFDYNEDYGMEVKISSISQGQFYVVNEKGNNEDLYYVDFEVTFTTLYDWAAKWIKSSPFWADSSGLNLVDNSFGQPFIKSFTTATSGNYTTYTITFENFHRIENYFTIEFKKELKITEGEVDIVDITTGDFDSIFYSEYGIAMRKTPNEFINASKISVIKIEPLFIKDYKIRVLTTEISKLKIIPVSREVL